MDVTGYSYNLASGASPNYVMEPRTPFTLRITLSHQCELQFPLLNSIKKIKYATLLSGKFAVMHVFKAFAMSVKFGKSNTTNFIDQAKFNRI